MFAQKLNMALRFVNVSESESIIEVFGSIGEVWDGEGKNNALCISEELARIKALKAQTITVKINSLGGDVNHALAIYDMLEEHDAEVTTQIIGLCASAATVIAAAGTTRKMSRNALFLIHQCSSWLGRANQTQLAAEIESQQSVNELILSIYTEKCGAKHTKDIETLFVANGGQGKWIEASEALRLGFVTDIYNESKKAACINKKAFENSFLPALPEEFSDFLTDETENQSVPQAQTNPPRNIFKSVKNLFTNKNQPSMKNLFPFLCIAASLADENYNKEKGVTLTDAQLQAIETYLKGFSDLQTTFETLKKETQTAKDSFTALQAKYNELKAITDKIPGETPQVQGSDVQPPAAQSFTDWQKNNKYYQEISVGI
jgi:ATP-dependent protease ClpP protease subunit